MRKWHLSFFVVSRDWVPIPAPSDCKIVEMIADDATTVPMTHHIPGTVSVSNGLISFQDLNTVFKCRDVTADGVFQWYYLDSFTEASKAGEEKLSKLPQHMQNLFFNTKTYNMAASDRIGILTFDSIPTIPVNTRKSEFVSFALSHMFDRKTKKTMTGETVKSESDSEIIRLDKPNSNWDFKHPYYKSHLDVDENKLVARQKKLQLRLIEMKYKELESIREELVLTDTIISGWLETTPSIVDLNSLLHAKLELRKLNRNLSQYTLR